MVNEREVVLLKVEVDGTKIAEILIARRISARELASASGVSYSALHRILGGGAFADVKTVGKICAGLKISPKEIYSEKERGRLI